MEQKNIENILLTSLAVSVGIIYINTFLYNVHAWYVADVLYILIALLFTHFCMKTAKHGWIIALLLWVPAVVVIYAAFDGWIGTEHMVWGIMNPLQLIVYSYLIGTRLHLK